MKNEEKNEKRMNEKKGSKIIEEQHLIFIVSLPILVDG